MRQIVSSDDFKTKSRSMIRLISGFHDATTLATFSASCRIWNTRAIASDSANCLRSLCGTVWFGRESWQILEAAALTKDVNWRKADRFVDYVDLSRQAMAPVDLRLESFTENSWESYGWDIVWVASLCMRHGIWDGTRCIVSFRSVWRETTSCKAWNREGHPAAGSQSSTWIANFDSFLSQVNMAQESTRSKESWKTTYTPSKKWLKSALQIQ